MTTSAGGSSAPISTPARIFDVFLQAYAISVVAVLAGKGRVVRRDAHAIRAVTRETGFCGLRALVCGHRLAGEFRHGAKSLLRTQPLQELDPQLLAIQITAEVQQVGLDGRSETIEGWTGPDVDGSQEYGVSNFGLPRIYTSAGKLAIVHAVFSIALRADQVVSGFAVNFLAFGITGYVFVAHYGDQGTPGDVPRDARVARGPVLDRARQRGVHAAQ